MVCTSLLFTRVVVSEATKYLAVSLIYYREQGQQMYADSKHNSGLTEPYGK